jgi:hypothetical protein
MPEDGNVFNVDSVDTWNVNTGSGTQNVQVNKNSHEATLEQIDQLIAKLLAGLAELPPGNAAVVAGEAVALKDAAHSGTSSDKGRIRLALQRLAEAAAPAAGMIELSRQLAELFAQLVH